MVNSSSVTTYIQPIMRKRLPGREKQKYRPATASGEAKPVIINCIGKKVSGAALANVASVNVAEKIE